MELEEMKAVWKELSSRLDNQEKINEQLIIRMAHQRSASRLSRIIRLESAGAIVSIAATIFIITQFHKLQDFISILSGIIVTAFLLISIVIGLLIVQRASKINIISKTYSQTYIDFKHLTALLKRYKQISLIGFFVLPVAMIPLIFVIILNKTAPLDWSKYLESLVAAVIILPIVWWLILKFYKRNISKVREAIDEVKELKSKSE